MVRTSFLFILLVAMALSSCSHRLVETRVSAENIGSDLGATELSHDSNSVVSTDPLLFNIQNENRRIALVFHSYLSIHDADPKYAKTARLLKILQKNRCPANEPRGTDQVDIQNQKRTLTSSLSQKHSLDRCALDLENIGSTTNSLAELGNGGNGWTILTDTPFGESWAASNLASLKSITPNGYMRGEVDKGGIFLTDTSAFFRETPKIREIIVSSIQDDIVQYGKKIAGLLNEAISKSGKRVHLVEFEIRWAEGSSNFRRVERSEEGHVDGYPVSMTWSNNQGTVIPGTNGDITVPSFMAAVMSGTDGGEGKFIVAPTKHYSPKPNEQPRFFIQWFFSE